MSQHRAMELDELWKTLVDTVHALPMYKNHKRYATDVVVKERPQISPQELAIQLNIPLGEAMVILNEIRGDTLIAKESDKVATARADRTLLDFGS